MVTSKRLKHISTFLLLCAVFLFGPSQASAVFIVDTGAPPAPPVGSAWYYAFDSSFAARFTLNQDYTITALEGWIWEGISAGTPWGNFGASSSTARVTIYGDGTTVPNVGQEIFTGAFSVPNNDPDSRPVDVPPSPYNWHGLSGLNIPLNAGSYWIAFESRPALGDDYYGAFGHPAPNPLLVDAYKVNGPYSSANYLNLGLRIQGEPTPPETWLFFLPLVLRN
jgi:hypothetical protein